LNNLIIRSYRLGSIVLSLSMMGAYLVYISIGLIIWAYFNTDYSLKTLALMAYGFGIMICVPIAMLIGLFLILYRLLPGTWNSQLVSRISPTAVLAISAAGAALLSLYIFLTTNWDAFLADKPNSGPDMTFFIYLALFFNGMMVFLYLRKFT